MPIVCIVCQVNDQLRSIGTSKCAIPQKEFANKPPPQTTNVQKAHSNTLQWQAKLWDTECCRNNSWGGKPYEASAADPPPQVEPHFHHLLREESLMGFRGKYHTKARDS